MPITRITNRVLATNSVGVPQLSAGAVAQSFGNSSGAFNFRNKIINGNFDFWQRGSSFTNPANATFTADKWGVSYDGSGAARTISRQPFILGQTEVPNDPIYFLRWSQSVAGTGETYNVLLQPVEWVRTLANKQVTVSFYARSSVIPINVAVYGEQFFGTGGSGVTYTAFPSVNVTTTWQKFTVNLTFPSLAGKTIGGSEDDRIVIGFLLPSNSVFTFDIAQVQLEEGTVATPFEIRPTGLEFSLCQRYYCVTNAGIRYRSVVASSYSENFVYWPVQMRRVPNVALVGVGTRVNLSSVDPVLFLSPTPLGCRFAVRANSAANADTYALNETVVANADYF